MNAKAGYIIKWRLSCITRWRQNNATEVRTKYFGSVRGIPRTAFGSAFKVWNVTIQVFNPVIKQIHEVMKHFHLFFYQTNRVIYIFLFNLISCLLLILYNGVKNTNILKDVHFWNRRYIFLNIEWNMLNNLF